MKEQFEGFDLKIIRLEAEDIITTSGPGEWNGEEEEDEI